MCQSVLELISLINAITNTELTEEANEVPSVCYKQ
jgi:hypothetical protein